MVFTSQITNKRLIIDEYVTCATCLATLVDVITQIFGQRTGLYCSVQLGFGGSVRGRALVGLGGEARGSSEDSNLRHHKGPTLSVDFPLQFLGLMKL